MDEIKIFFPSLFLPLPEGARSAAKIPLFRSGDVVQGKLNPSGPTRNSKEVPVDKDSRRRPRRLKGKREPQRMEEDAELEEGEDPQKDKAPVGKVVDITI